jgi:peptidoglycan/xylan/chitin deacetylase (PgdA/CDA1 family)
MTFKSTCLSFAVTICFISAAHVFFGASLTWLLFPTGIFLLLLVYGSANIRSNFFVPVLSYQKCSEKMIALSFDDGPHPEFTPQVLALLAQYEALATFFVIGKNIQGNEFLLKEIDAAGHSIGNHSYTHGFFIDFKSVQGFMDELNETAQSVFNVIGKRMSLFRPPYGVITPSLAKVIKILDYHVIGWSIRSFDTTASSVQTIAQRIQSQLQSGAIVLFHDTSDKTLHVLKQTLEFAKENGYNVVSVEHLLKIDAYE